MAISCRESEALGIISEINEEIDTLKDLIVWRINDVNPIKNIINNVIPNQLKQILDIINSSPSNNNYHQIRITKDEAKSIKDKMNEIAMKFVNFCIFNDEDGRSKIKDALTAVILEELPMIKDPIDAVGYDIERPTHINIVFESSFHKLLEEALNRDD